MIVIETTLEKIEIINMVKECGIDYYEEKE